MGLNLPRSGLVQQFVQADPASWRRLRVCPTLASVRHPATGRLNSGAMLQNHGIILLPELLALIQESKY